MTEVSRFVWAFFKLSGRLDRKTYALATALSYIVRMLTFYQFLRHPLETPQSDFWAMLFMITLALSLWANVALSVKRLHDMDKSGALAPLTIVLDVLLVVALAILPGSQGSNRYGRCANMPAGEN